MSRRRHSPAVVEAADGWLYCTHWKTRLSIHWHKAVAVPVLHLPVEGLSLPEVNSDSLTASRPPFSIGALSLPILEKCRRLAKVKIVDLHPSNVSFSPTYHLIMCPYHPKLFILPPVTVWACVELLASFGIVHNTRAGTKLRYEGQDSNGEDVFMDSFQQPLQSSWDDDYPSRCFPADSRRPIRRNPSSHSYVILRCGSGSGALSSVQRSSCMLRKAKSI